MKKTVLLFTLLLTLTVFGQSNEEVLTNASVINLHSKGLSSSIIVSKIKTSKSNFDVSIDALIKLKEKKIPDDIVNAMVEASGKEDNSTGNVNDPNSAHESGIYYFKPVDGKNELINLEPTVCSQTNTGSGIATALTYGIAKTNIKAKLDGGSSRLKLTETRPVFYFYFDKGENLNNSATGFASSSSPNEFILVKLIAKTNNREFVTGSYNAYSGMSSGVDEKYRVDFEIEKIKSGIYKVTPKSALMPGEYCFVHGGNISSNGTTGKVYDFGIAK